MLSPTLSERIERSLRRQIEAFSEILLGLADIEMLLQEEPAEHFMNRQRMQQRQTEELIREYRALLREAQTDDHFDEPARAALRPLAAEANELNERLRARYDEACLVVQQTLRREQQLGAALRRGRDMLSAYRAGESGTSDLLDRSV